MKEKSGSELGLLVWTLSVGLARSDAIWLNSTRAASSHSGTPSRPTGFTLAVMRRSIDAGLYACLDLEAGGQI